MNICMMHIICTIYLLSIKHVNNNVNKYKHICQYYPINVSKTSWPCVAPYLFIFIHPRFAFIDQMELSKSLLGGITNSLSLAGEGVGGVGGGLE